VLPKLPARWNLRTLACRTTVVAIAILAVGAVSAQAASTLSKSGATLTIQGSGGVDEVDVSYLQPASGLSPGYTRIEDPNGGVSGPLPAGCTSFAYTGFYGPTTRVECEDGGHNGAGDPIPFIDNLVVTLGAGGDRGNVSDCYDDVAIDVGDGDNTAFAPACTTGVYEVTSGSGVDEVTSTDARTAPFTANLGGGDDHFSGGGGTDIVHGGNGDDRMYGEGGNDQLYGEGDADNPDGGAGDDLVDGGAGDDGLEKSLGVSNDPGLGADTYVGGPGTDQLLLDAHAPGVAISLNGAADDGRSGEGDNVGSDIEEIDATDGNDSFTGSAGNDGFYGRIGNDTIHGAGGDDNLRGAGGDDSIFGDGGNDKLEGSTGADTVDGGSGSDQMYGDQANCVGVFICTPDPDTLRARDGERDTVDCGGGADTADVDDIDVVAYCANVTITKTGEPPPGCVAPNPACPPPPSKTTFSFTTSGKRSRAKGIAVKVTCSAKCTFGVKLEIAAKVAKKAKLGRKAVTIGSAKGSLGAAGSQTVTVKLSSKARSKLKKLKTVAGTLKVAAADAGGATTNLKQGVKTVR
jgi:Ca2+-binding RTX toxin-like protein